MGAEGTSLMAIATRQSLALETLLKLGRVSNLPTVWTNVLTGTVLGGGSPWSGRTSIVALAMSTRFAVDTRRAPQRIVDAHPSDQRVQTRIDLWPTTADRDFCRATTGTRFSAHTARRVTVRSCETPVDALGRGAFGRNSRNASPISTVRDFDSVESAQNSRELFRQR
jgi:hypothetical protein